MQPLNIVADENIPFVKEAFSDFGNVTTMPGRNITNNKLKNADILLVRSVTKVNARLLEGTSISFVGTATIGIDHIDTEALQQRYIGFAHAPGSNAESVAEYVLSSLCELARTKHFSLRNRVLGIIGVGNIGSKVWKKAKMLGIQCLLCDPPKKRLMNSSLFKSHKEVYSKSDIVTLHVPLQKQGDDATYHMINDETFSAMKSGSILINTSRGNVVDENALLRHVVNLKGLVLDVWEHEPDINREVLSATDIATPHIAGYSYEGKLRGTQMIYNAACDFFFREKKWHMNKILKKEQEQQLDVSDSQTPLCEAVSTVYPICKDDDALRDIKNVSIDERGQFYDRLRKNYPTRREFSHYRVTMSQGGPTAEALSGLGFKTRISS